MLLTIASAETRGPRQPCSLLFILALAIRKKLARCSPVYDVYEVYDVSGALFLFLACSDMGFRCFHAGSAMITAQRSPLC